MQLGMHCTYLDPALFELNLPRVHVTSILQLGDLRLRRHTVIDFGVPSLQGQLLLELLVVSLQLLDCGPVQHKHAGLT